MSSSYHGNTSSSMNNETNTLVQMSSSLIENVNSNAGNIMVQSLDPTILNSPSMKLTSDSISVRSVIPLINGKPHSIFCHSGKKSERFEKSFFSPIFLNVDYQTRQCPLVATSKIVPVPETLMSPDCPPTSVVQSVIHTTPAPAKTDSTLPNQKVSSIKSTKGLNHSMLLSQQNKRYFLLKLL